MPMRACTVVRVFTRGEAGGNHLGVIAEPLGLDTAAMQSIAADLGFSETAFVDWQAGEVPFVRIFTPKVELPFAGHPLVGTAWVLTVMGPATTDRLRCGIGEVAIRVDGATTWIDVPMTGHVADSGDVAGEFVRAGMPPPRSVGRVMVPGDYMIGELADEDAVASLRPDRAVLVDHLGTLAYSRRGDQVRARFFAPGAGVDEDPATGSAAVALAILLSGRGESSGRLTILQGEEIGHPSRIELSWADGTASIGGTVARDEVRVLEI